MYFPLMDERTFTYAPLADQSPSVQERCERYTRRKDAKSKNWATAEDVWRKAQEFAQICYFSNEEALDGLETMPDIVAIKDS